MAERIAIVGPDGTPGTIESNDVDEALRQGYRLPLEKQAPDESALGTAASALDVAGTAAVGGLEGLTGGLFGAALGKGSTPEAAQFVKAQEKAHPIAKGIGELAGMVASPLNEVGTALEGAVGATSALGRIGASAMGGAATTSLFGAGNELSEQMLGDSTLNGQKLIAAAGLGGLLGAAGGGLGAVIGEGVKAAAPALKKVIGGKAIEDFAEDRWLKAGGAIQSDIKKIAPQDRAAVADVIREHMGAGQLVPKTLDDALASMQAERASVGTKVLGELGIQEAGGLAPKMSREEALEAVANGLEANGQRTGEVLKAADAMGAKPEYSRIYRRLEDFEAGLNPAERDLVASDLDKYRGYIHELGQRPANATGKSGSSFSALNDLKSTLQKDTNWTADGSAKFGLKRQIAGIFRDEIDTQLAPQIGSDLAKDFLDSKAAFGALSRAEKALGRKAATGADAISAMVEDAALKTPAASRLSALNDATKLAQHGIDRVTGNRWLSASDYLTGLGGVAMSGNPLTALASSIGHKVLREKGSGIIASLADRIAASPALGAVAQSFGQKAGALLPAMGRYGATLGNALAGGHVQALATHLAHAQLDPEYQDTALMAGIAPEPSDETPHTMARAQQLAAVQAALAQVDRSIDNGINAALAGGKAAPAHAQTLGHQDFGAMRMRRDTEGGHQKRLDEVRELAGNPEALAERVAQSTGGLGAVAPGMVAANAKALAAGVAYLAQQTSEPVGKPPLARDWAHSGDDRHRFLEALGVIEQPMSVLKHAAAGTLTPGHVRALQAAYPEFAQHIADRVAERLTEGPKVPYRQRLQLSWLTGIDPDGTMGPQSIASNQAAIRAAATQSSKPSQGPTSPPAKGKASITVAQRSAMPNESRESSSER